MRVYEEFTASLKRSDPPGELTVPLRGLWLVAKGDWNGAHILQDDPSDDAVWVHAHLHRIEGDVGNAGYWYNRSGRRRMYRWRASARRSCGRCWVENKDHVPH